MCHKSFISCYLYLLSLETQNPVMCTYNYLFSSKRIIELQAQHFYLYLLSLETQKFYYFPLSINTFQLINLKNNENWWVIHGVLTGIHHKRWCLCSNHRPQFERFLKDFFDEHERHLAENFHAFCVIL